MEERICKFKLAFLSCCRCFNRSQSSIIITIRIKPYDLVLLVFKLFNNKQSLNTILYFIYNLVCSKCEYIIESSTLLETICTCIKYFTCVLFIFINIIGLNKESQYYTLTFNLISQYHIFGQTLQQECALLRQC